MIYLNNIVLHLYVEQYTHKMGPRETLQRKIRTDSNDPSALIGRLLGHCLSVCLFSFKTPRGMEDS
jgi:hypothetical protein